MNGNYTLTVLRSWLCRNFWCHCCHIAAFIVIAQAGCRHWGDLCCSQERICEQILVRSAVCLSA